MQTLLQLYSTAELKLMAFAGVAWTLISKALGGIDEPISALFYLVIADFTTGVIASFHTATWSSDIGRKGMLKKIFMFSTVALMYCIDVSMGTSMLRGMAITGFSLIEAMSILENIDRMGYGEYIPDFIRNKLMQIRDSKGV